MYSVQVHTSDSTADYGTNIATTEKLKNFLCALDMRLITHLEINYYRELSTGQIPVVIPNSVTLPEAIQPANESASKSSNWEPDNMGLPL